MIVYPLSFGNILLFFRSISGLIVPQISSDPNAIKFFIYTKDGDARVEHELLYNDTNSISQSPMNSSLPTIVIIHGYRRNRTGALVDRLLSAYMSSSDPAKNYLVVDWGALSGIHDASPTVQNFLDPTIYTTVLTRSFPIVVRRTSEFIKKLVSMDLLRLSDLHIIGRSLGAHISGHVGRELQEIYGGTKVARVTGLDPAGPGFEGLIKVQTKIKKGDANFVDIYHSAVGTMGDTSVDGHVDFYPNGGKVQPACPQDSGILPPLNDPFGKGACSHEFSTNIYAATINNIFKACRCDAVKISSSHSESCDDTCPDPVVAGENVPRTTTGQYYFRTSDNP